jgi:hypothetical protein
MARKAGTADLDALVRSIDLLDGARLDDDGLDRALDEVGAAIAARPPLSLRRRRRSAQRRGVLVAVAAVLALALVAAAGARLFINADTGVYPKGWERKAGGPGQEINLAGTNFSQVARKAAGDIPYPAEYGSWRTWVITTAAADRSCPAGSPRGCTMQVSTGALRGAFAQSAFCAWVYDWRQATLSGDAGAAGRAARVIDRAPSWSAVVALDPHPSAAPPYTNPRYHGHMTDFGWLLPFRSAVLKGDVSFVDQLIAANYGVSGCAFERPPAGSKDGTVIPRRLRSR